MTGEWLQYGAMGLLAMVLCGVGWGLVHVGVPLVKSLVTSINGLRDEVASFRVQQATFSRLLTLLLVREFGEKRALELVREEPDEQPLQHGPREGRNQEGRGQKPS